MPRVAVPLRLPVLTCGVYVVYAECHETETSIYVGRSFSIAYRRIGSAISRFSDKYELTGVEFHPCSSREEAHELEGRLIAKLSPLENTQRRSRNKRMRNRMSDAEEAEIFREISAVLRKHRTTMKRVSRVMEEGGQRNVANRGN